MIKSMIQAPSLLSGFNGRISLLVHWRALLIAMALAVVMAIVAGTSLMSGSYPLPLSGVWATLVGNAPDNVADTVVWEFRFPRMIVAVITGAFFGLSGAILQNVTRNPLADPSLVGVSQGASLAVVTLIVGFPEISHEFRPMAAFAGALIVAAFIQWIAMKRNGGATMRFILTGIGVAAFISSITTAYMTYGNIYKASEALGWLAGSIHAANWGEVTWLGLCFMASIPLLFLAVRPMKALRMGPEVATGLGVQVRFTRAGLITLSVALAAFGVAAVGPLGFVGLVAPHLSRRIAHCGVGQHLLLTGLTGAVMVGLADYLGRVAFASVQIPAGILTAIIGVPIFLLLIVRSQYHRQL